MRKIIFIVCLFCLPKILGAQNLVPNGSFEKYSSCPDNTAQLFLAYPWFEGPSSEYFNGCSPSPFLSVPFNAAGYQPAKTGKGYVSYLFFDGGNYREYAEVMLKDTLLANKNYCIKYYVVLSAQCNYTIDALGAYLSNDTVFCGTSLIPVIPQVENLPGNYVTDTANWVSIEGTYNAIGGEKYLVIGNFKDFTQVSTLILGYGTVNRAYFYVDDVSVYPCDAPVFIAEAGNDQNICMGDSIQIGDTTRSEYIYWWTPTNGLSNDSIANPKASPAVTTTYYLHQKDFKFDETIDSVTVFVYPALPDNAAGQDTLICEGGQAQLGIAAGAYNYHWQFSSDLSDTAIANPTAMPLNTSTYILTISNTGCSKTDSVTVTVENCDTVKNSLTIVNAFTPNNDGKNDYFHIKGTNISSVHLKIINRWGQQLYEGMGENVKWDGTYDGKEISAGVYYYIAEVVFKDGEVRNKKGSIHLIQKK